jgi:ppGpp synthetase/RelA/SpoT-type nucleotidyltranferase
MSLMNPPKRYSTFLKALENEYGAQVICFEDLCVEMVKQIDQLLRDAHINLASPIESRVKTWASIVDKIKRNQIQPKALAEIRDVAGVRTIALFRRDMEPIQKIIESNFKVVHKEDTFTRLRENQFGYGSIHYEVQPPPEWLKIPTLKKLDGLRAEIQVRTSSQHIWAAASHILQYKKVTHVPPPILRTINRVAALLETIDLEFERVLVEREEYTQQISQRKDDIPLNTESLKRLLDAILPSEHRDDLEGEDYADLLDDLLRFNVRTTRKFERIVKKHLKAVIKEDELYVQASIHELESGQQPSGTSEERTRRRVYFTHVGLARTALQLEVGGKKFMKYFSSKFRK